MTNRYFHTNFPNVRLKADCLPVRYSHHANQRTAEKGIPVITEFDGRANKLVEIDVVDNKVIKYLYEVEEGDTLYSYALIHKGSSKYNLFNKKNNPNTDPILQPDILFIFIFSLRSISLR